MKKWIKTVIGLLLTVILVLTGVFIFSYLMLDRNLPEYSGEEITSGISGNVEILRDDFGIPNIFASTDNDAAFSIGFLHAQERMFQMELMRRAGEGRLSEIFGSKTLNYDKLFRTLGFSEIARKTINQLDEKVLSLLKSYSDGINFYLEKHPEKLGIEFDVLDYQPENWKPEHSIIIGKLLAWELNISWWVDVSFSNLIQKLGTEKVKDILPDFPENAPTVIPKNLNRYSNITTELINLDKEFRNFIGFNGTHIGSNNWVINGKKSETGKPIIANDPHLSLQTPSKWYFINCFSEELNFNGFTLPGIPFSIIGKNNSISWVVTNVMADDADFYIEQFDETKTKYLVDVNWKNLNIKIDTIFVKDSEQYELTIRKTHRGPVVSDIHNYKFMDESESAGNNVISMRWTALEFNDEINSVYKINTASDWNDFKSALKNYSAPGQNFVYADTSGNIGYVCGVKLPRRNNNSQTFIFDGTKSDNDWLGYVNYNALPKMFNPKQNFIATANNKTKSDFPYHISNLWEPQSRIKRITELLNSKEEHTNKDFEKYQNDLFSYYSKEIVGYILRAFKNVNIKDENLNIALEQLSKWDFKMDKESQAPAIYEVFFQKLMYNIFNDEMGDKLFQEYVFVANVPYRTVRKLLDEKYSSWFDNINTEEFETRDEIIRNSMADAMVFLEEKIGNDIADWQWGRIHKVEFKHFFSGQNSMVDKILNIGPFELGGSGTTIFNTEYSFSNPYFTRLGPSMRYIYNYDSADKLYMVLPTGQSGHFLSDHYDDFTKLWLDGNYHTIELNPEKIKNSDFKKYRLLAN